MALGNTGLKNWDDKPVVIVGGGSSLLQFKDKLQTLHQKYHVLAVNNSYQHCHPEVIFSLDHQWLKNSFAFIPSMPAPVFCAVADDHPMPSCKNLTYLWRRDRIKAYLSISRSEITNGHNSGYGALNFAFLKGAKRIYLLGFDFKIIEEKKHFHEGYTWTSPQDPNRVFPIWAKLFDDCVPQLQGSMIEVFNCSPNSLLTAFPYKPYDEVM